MLEKDKEYLLEILYQELKDQQEGWQVSSKYSEESLKRIIKEITNA